MDKVLVSTFQRCQRAVGCLSHIPVLRTPYILVIKSESLFSVYNVWLDLNEDYFTLRMNSKLDIMTHSCNPWTQDVEAGENQNKKKRKELQLVNSGNRQFLFSYVELKLENLSCVYKLNFSRNSGMEKPGQ